MSKAAGYSAEHVIWLLGVANNDMQGLEYRDSQKNGAKSTPHAALQDANSPWNYGVLVENLSEYDVD